MNRRQLLTGLVAGSIVTMTTPVATASNIKPPAVWLSPHSDDLVLSMSSAIGEHLKAGRQNIFVLMTSGGSQWVLDAINAKLTTKIVMPAAINSRINEYKDEINAYRRNGQVLDSQIKGFTDGGLSYDNVQQTILGIEQQYPGADFKVMTYADSHKDHAMCGKVAKDLAVAGKIKAPRYYIKYDDILSGRAKGLNYWRETADKTIINQASSGYKVWKPEIGRYAFGYTSVPGAFAYLDANAASHVHA